MFTKPLEADVRNQVNKQLENLGWILDPKNPKKNVFVEQPKLESERKLLKGKRPDYVLYEKDKNIPLIVIETKKRGCNINDALEQGYNYARLLEVPIVFATDGVYCKTIHTGSARPLILNGEEIDEFIRELLAIKFLETNEVNTISKKVIYSRQELIKVFDDANNMLRVEGLRAGIERFSEFANILFLKLISENENIKEEKGEKRTLSRELSWDYFKNKKEGELLKYVNNVVLKEFAELYKDENIFSQLLIKDGKVLKRIIDKLDVLTLTDIYSDIKGDAFEYFLKATTATGNDLGEYFTPRHIVKMMVKLANPQIGEKIYDPFCGTGGLLIESYRHIYNNMAQTSDNIKRLKKNTIYGNEITNTARITKMNMILAGDGHSNIKMINSIAHPLDNKFDVVLTNMPYSQATEYGKLYDIPTKNGDSICVQHCIRAIDKMAPNGRMAMVVPEGFLFRNDLKTTREYLLKNCYLQSVISLPQGVFLPYTGVKTNILYCTKIKQKNNQKHYWYFEVKNDGHTLDNHRKKIEGNNDIDNFLAHRVIEEQEKEEVLKIGFSIIDIKEVKRNDFILSGNSYKRQTEFLNSKFEFTELKNVCSFVRGMTFSKADQLNSETDSSIRIVSTRAAQEDGIVEKQLYFIKSELVKDQEKIIKKNDILISLANSLSLVGRVTFIDEIKYRASFGAFMGLIRADINKIDPLYLYYQLKSSAAKQFYLDNSRTTTNISNLTFAILSEFKIPLPPLKAQKLIVNKIEKELEEIDKNKKLIEIHNNNIKKQISDIWGI